MSAPPFHKTYENLLRYRTVIAALVRTFPTPLIFRPVGFSCETVTCRVRNGLKELFAHDDWQLEGFDKAVLKTIFEQVTFSHDGTFVRIGKGDKKARQLEEINQQVNQSQGLVVKNPPPEVFQALLTLHSYQILSAPTEISEPVLPQSYLDMAAQTPNIDLSSDGKRYFLI